MEYLSGNQPTQLFCIHQTMRQAVPQIQPTPVNEQNMEVTPHIDPDVLRKDVLYPILGRFGIPRPSGASGFHAFRHSVGSFINAQSGNLKLAQNLLGHSTINMTADVYTHVSRESEREAAQAVERAIYGDLFPICSQVGNGNKSAGELSLASVTARLVTRNKKGA